MEILKSWRVASLTALVAVLMLLVVACGDGEDEPAAGGAVRVSGNVVADGSSTVFPISEAVAEEFGRANREVRVTVGVSGTGGGFKKFCAGETDISNASRPISESEKAQCQQAGIQYTELPVALDGLAVVVNPRNTWADCVTTAELKKIWEPSSTVKKWNEVRASWPDREIKLFGAGTDSGTFDYFTTVINGKEKASRADYTSSEDDNVLVNGVTGSENALGYFGYAYYAENKNILKVLKVDSGKGCIEPSDATVQDGTYAPLARPIFIYTNNKSLAEKPQVREFIRYYVSPSSLGQLVGQAGYTPLPDAEQQKTRARFEAATPQT